MTTLLVWAAVVAGVLLTARAARAFAGWPAAGIAAVALVVGQFVAFRPTLPDAVLFALAALAVERAQAMRARSAPAAVVLALVPGVLVLWYRLGWPSVGRMADVLFCTQHGVAATSAIVGLGLVGLAWGAMTDRRMWTWVASLLFVIFIAAGEGHDALDWRGAFNAFLPALPMIGLGVAVLAQRGRDLAERHPARAAVALAGPLVVWNLTLFGVAHAGILRIGEPVSFGVIGAAQARTLHDWTGHPFTFPASLVFAARNRQPPSRFDVLGSGHVDATHPLAIDVGDADSAFLGAGWHAPEREGDRTFRWAMAQAIVRLPAMPPGSVKLRVHARAFAPPGSAPQTISVQWSDRVAGPASLPVDWTWIEFELDALPATGHVTDLVLRLDHAISPKAAGLGGDPRELGAAIDAVELITSSRR